MLHIARITRQLFTTYKTYDVVSKSHGTAAGQKVQIYGAGFLR